MAKIEKQEIEKITSDLIASFGHETVGLSSMLSCLVNALDSRYAPGISQMTTYLLMDCIDAKLKSINVPWNRFAACVEAHQRANGTLAYLQSLPEDSPDA